MSVEIKQIKYQTLKEYIVKYIILKIQSKEWKRGEAIPSERWFMIKFKVSKSLISAILSNLKQSNIIYSIPRQGYYITNNETAFIASQSEFFTPNNIIVKHQGSGKLSRNDIVIINQVLKRFDLQKRQIKVHDFIYYSKKYYAQNQLLKAVLFAVKNSHIIPNEMTLIKQSIYKMMAYRGIPLVKKLEFHTITSNDENGFPFFNSNVFNKSHYEVTFQLYQNYESEIVLITKNVYNITPKKYYSVRKISII